VDITVKQLVEKGLLHGADYNPEQWLKHPEVLAQDIELMKQAGCNVMSIGIFSWAMLEPQEGCYEFDWLDDVIQRLHTNGISVILATPSGARPVWLAQKYPEVLRVSVTRQQALYGGRHNHCYTSPVYRDKIMQLNTRLSERYAHHPAVVLWHISNEYGGECHCSMCQAEFRCWLQEKYGSLDRLNEQWWTTFWSHTYSDWSQIESPSPQGESATHGLNLDWKRFVTDRTIDFLQHEVRAVRSYRPELPITTNFMYYYDGLNYFKFKDIIDIVSWDNYPTWHKGSDLDIAIDTAMFHDMMRSIKNKPFLLMESSPSSTNWQSVSKLKKPGMHILSSMQAIAHGSDSVQYFQWRKSRGSSEKFHGAVVSHDGGSQTRVFQEVAKLGEMLKQLPDVVGSQTKSEVAIIYDWENKWAIEDSQGPRNIGMGYKYAVQSHYRSFHQQGIAVDFVDMECDFAGYKLVVAPMIYMLRGDIDRKLQAFVQQGGTLVLTYWSGIVNENDLCHLGPIPHKLTDVVGIIAEEIDGLYDQEHNNGKVVMALGSGKLQGEYRCTMLCDLVQLNGAKVLMEYTENFYAGKPVLTQHSLGNGEAYYIATQFEQSFYDDFYGELIDRMDLHRVVDVAIPEGVLMNSRTSENTQFLFIQNYSPNEQPISALGEEWHAVSREVVLHEEFKIEPYEVLILKRPVG